LYEGGEIYFPRLDWSYKPKANTLLVFPSNDKFVHGVTKVTKGERYTFAIWYTQDFQYLEI
jgi:predicted 2-oxoglutarate/Fe(II)-dependent dioxygenase YbiX